MRRWRWLVAIGAGMMVLVLLAAANAQTQKRIDQFADITSEEWTLNLAKKTWTFTGNVEVKVSGPDQAIMKAPKMTGKMDKKNRIVEIIAHGPVEFEITTKPDKDGIRRHIQGKCLGEGKYVGGSRIVTLTGGAEATMTDLPPDPDIEPYGFAAETLTVNMETLDVTAKGEPVHIKVQFPQSKLEEKNQ